jgi:hypothetical protein
MNTFDLNQQYLCLTCKEGIITQRILTRPEKLQLCRNTQDVDFFYDATTGEYFIRTKKNKLLTGLEISNGSWSLLESILYKAGDLLPLESENHVSATVRRIRSLFQDNKQGHFIITQREPFFAIRWNISRSWQVIKPLETGKADQAQPNNP